MKILIAADTYYPNVDGASYFTQRLAEQLKKRGHDILVIAPSSSKHPVVFLHNEVRCAQIFSWPTFFHKNYRFSPPFFIKNKIETIIKNFQPDIVHIQGHFFIERAAAAIARALNIPILATNHFMPENLLHYAHLPRPLENQLCKLAWKDFRSVFKKISAITTPTQTGAAVLKKIGLPQTIIPVSCGIDLARFNSNHPSEYLRQRFNIPNLPVLLSVGRLAPEKNIDLVIRAFAMLPAAVKIHLVIVGNGTEKIKLEKLAAKLGVKNNITFTGFLPDEDMASVYALARAFVTAGEVELQSLVTMEAMATGLPIVAINALALPELVHHNENGFLFEPADAAGMAACIERLFTDPNLRARMSKESLKIISAHDIEKTMTVFEKLYQKITAKNI